MTHAQTTKTGYSPHPLRIQRRRAKGWRLPGNAVSVARPSHWGNPFTCDACIEAGYAESVDDARHQCVEAFRDWLEKGDLSVWWFEAGRAKWERMRRLIGQLAGRRLACFCPLDVPCHADVLAELANPS